MTTKRLTHPLPSLSTIALVLVASLHAATAAAQQSAAHTLPKPLPGGPEANPVIVEGQALWRIDQVWPDDPLQAANYSLMPWTDKQWAAGEHAHGGQPAAAPQQAGLALAVRGPWSGQPGAKIAALSFIAPENGAYKVRGRLNTQVWSGGGGVPLRIIRLPEGDGEGTEVATFDLPDTGEMDLTERMALYQPTVRLKRGQRLAFVPHIASHNRAGTVVFADLTVERTAPPAEEDFVGVYDGHLYMNGERVRFWSTAGVGPASSGIKPEDTDEVKAEKLALARAKNEHIIQRMKDMGFNMFRMWDAPAYNRSGADPDPYTKGDGSRKDMLDHLLWVCKQNGIKVWFASFGNATGNATPEDVGIIDDPETAAAWQAAVGENKHVNLRHSIARVWDPRLEALYIAHARDNADHVNQYTGLRYGDDPAIAVWELTNEEWWIRRMTGGHWQKQPQFFKQELIEGWHQFLEDKYGNQEGLIEAWGFLLDGENLEQRTTLLAPIQKESKPVTLNDVNPRAIAKFEAVEQTVGRDDFARQRGADVLEYFTGLLVSHKERVAAQVKAWGRSCGTSPVIYDTGIGSNIQAQFMHQHADASVHNAYISGTTTDKTSRRHPFYSWLERYPRICYDVPWLEHNRVPGKPFFCYETQIGQPAKYRAEYPWKLVALASIQDWDIISWHYYASGTPLKNFPDADNPYDIPLSWPGPGAYQYHFIMDEVQMSAMRAAAEVFTQNLLKPAPDPTTFVWGRQALYDPASMDYAGSYGKEGLMDMLATAYRHGVRNVIDPSRKDNEVIGPRIRQIGWDKPNPVIPTGQIEQDWKKGHIIFDAPATAMYVGFMASYGPKVEFENNVALTNVTIENDEGIPYPVTEDEKFVSFCVTALDKQPLAETQKALISLVSSSSNTEMSVEEGKRGTLPVLHARVSADIRVPMLDGMNYTLRDWHMRKIGEGQIENGVLKISAAKPIFLIELNRTGDDG